MSQVAASPGNFSKFPKGEPFYLQGIASKIIKGVQIHSDVTTGTPIHLKSLPLVVPPSRLFFSPIIGMDVLTKCHATWNKPRFLAFLVRLAKWALVTFPPPVKMVDTPEHQLKQGTEDLRLVIKDILETRVIKPTIPPF